MRVGVRMLAVGGAVAVAGLLVWRVLGAGGDAVPHRTGEPDLASQLAQLEERLGAEIQAREALELQVAELQSALTSLEPASGPVGPDERAEPAAEDEARAGDVLAPGALRAIGRRLREGPTFDVARLVEAGLPERDAEWLRERYEASQLDTLYLRDQALREGWERGTELPQALQAQSHALREELGEDMYDWMLYGSGRPNRVRVRDVYESSAGAGIGLEPGDVILSYAGQRVYHPGELRRATTAVELGQLVIIEFERDDEVISRQIAGGPIGAPVRPARHPPAGR